VSGVDIRPVGSNRRLLAAYVDVPWRVYAGDPTWVPPLKSDMRRQLNRRKNPFFGHANVEHFVAFDDARPVGRIAATIYPPYNERFGPKTGFFGFFETIEDETVANALLESAESWLRTRGMERVSGPYSYCATQDMGLLVEGFDTPPALFQMHNPPYYERFLGDRGYEREFRMEAGCVTKEQWTALGPMLRQMGDAVREQANLRVRPLDKKRFFDDMEIIRRLFNDSFAANDAVTPFEQDVFRFTVKALKPFVEPEMITIVEKDGRPVAFTAIVPNLNEVLKKLDGRIGITDLLRIRKTLRGIRSAVLLLIGALPEVHGVGIGRTLLGELFRVGETSRYEALHTTWIHESNWSSRSLAAQWQLEPTKRYVIVGKAL
jgi:GNAT superfamily N-acetyltransferase